MLAVGSLQALGCSWRMSPVSSAVRPLAGALQRQEGEKSMPWYAAHIILYTKFLAGVQDTYHVWENVVMIHAPTSDEAYARADRKGLSEAGGDGYTYDGRPAVWVYAGVRKLSECIEDFDPAEQAAGGMEEDGTEVTYSSFVLGSEAALQELVAGRSVSLTYEGHEDTGASSSEAA